MKNGMRLKVDREFHLCDFIPRKRLARFVFSPVCMPLAEQCLDSLFVRQRFQRLRLSRVIRVQPPVMPVRPDNPAAEKDGDGDTVSLDRRCKPVIASMSVVDRNDQGLWGKALGRLAGPRCQEVGKRHNVIAASQSGKMNVRPRCVECMIYDDRHFIALPYFANYEGQPRES